MEAIIHYGDKPMDWGPWARITSPRILKEIQEKKKLEREEATHVKPASQKPI